MGRVFDAILTSKAIDDIATDPRLGRADKLKRIKEQLRRLRFPRLAETEDAIRAKIQALKLHARDSPERAAGLGRRATASRDSAPRPVKNLGELVGEIERSSGKAACQGNISSFSRPDPTKSRNKSISA